MLRRWIAPLVLLLLLITGTAGLAQDEATALTIIHTSSLYNHIEEFTLFRQPLQGGAPRIATTVNTIRAEQPNTILVSSGRDIVGTPMFAQYGGVASAEVMARLGYDAALVTEVDLGAGGSVDAFQVYNSVVDFPLLSANLDLTNLPDLDVMPNTIIETDGGVRVGVFGLSNESGGALTNLGEAVGLIPVDEVLADNLATFADADVDIIVLLSALGVARDAEIANEYPQIDVIVGNDSSVVLGEPADFEETGLQPAGPYPLVFHEESTPTLVVYGGKFGSYVGELNLEFDAGGVLQSWAGGLRFMSEAVEPDTAMQTYVDQLVAGIDLDTIVIGEAADDLPGSFRDNAWQETALANIYADAFLEAGRAFDAEIALVNAGAVWDAIPSGEITLAELTRAQPFFNWLVVTDLTGAQLVAALEHGVSNYGAPSGESGPFLHVAGVSYTVDPSAESGARVADVMVAGEPLDPDARYTVAINDYMANGGDGYAVLRDGSNTFNTGLTITEILQQYIETHSPLTMPDMGRIAILTD